MHEPTAGAAARRSGAADLAGVEIALDADSGRAVALVERVLAEIGTRAGTERDPQGYVHVTARALPELPRSRGFGGVEVAGDIVQWRIERAGLVIRTRAPGPDAPFEAWVSIEDRPIPYRLPRRAFRWVEPTFLEPARAQAYAFIPTVLESLALLHSRTHAPLHAAAIERADGALVLTSAGGVGKTSTSMAYLAQGRGRFLSDDITMLDESGHLAPYGRLSMVYDYNLQANPAFAAAVRSQGGRGGRLHWAMTRPLHGGGRRRRMAPDTLFGRPVMGQPTTMAAAGFLVRASHGEVTTHDLQADELARRSVAILSTEFSLLIEVLHLAEAAGHPALVDPMLDRAQRLLRSAFQGSAQLFEVRIPPGAPAEQVVEVIESRLAR